MKQTNACVLRAIVAIDPRNPLASQFANWLAVNRRHGEFWDSTRDTALAVHALSDYLRATAKTSPNFAVTVEVDGRKVADVPVGWKQVLAGDCRVEFAGKELRPGPHRITLKRAQPGSLYYALSARYFDRSEQTQEKGTGIQVARRYYKLAPSPAVAEQAASAKAASGQTSGQRSLLNDGNSVRIGDTVQVELSIESHEPYEYVAFEDPKPAGFEPIELQSGYGDGDIWSNVELRDENVVFFADALSPGKHRLSYQLRAEIPGTFHARPTRAFDMYNPRIAAHGTELKLRVLD